jgi:hypothetical protein
MKGLRAFKGEIYESGSVGIISDKNCLYFNRKDGAIEHNNTYKENTILSSMDHYGIVGMLDLEFSKTVFLVTKVKIAAETQYFKICRIEKVESLNVYQRNIPLSLDEEEFETVQIREIIKQFDSSNVYFSLDVDLTLINYSLMNKNSSNSAEPDDRFFWNKCLLSTLLSQNHIKFVIPVITGYVESFDQNFTLISRISRKKAGVRFWSRGSDKEGNVAVEVETSISLFNETQEANYKIIRGSVPLFWNHNELSLIRKPKIDHLLADSTDSVIGFATHFNRLVGTYGPVAIIDLVKSIN